MIAGSIVTGPTCKRSSTRSKGLSSTVPFLVGHITGFVRVNRRFRLEPVLVSNRAVPSLLTCKRAYNHGLNRVANRFGILKFLLAYNNNKIISENVGKSYFSYFVHWNLAPGS